MTVIDGATNSTLLVPSGTAPHPGAVAANPTTNAVYVANELSNNVTVIADVPAKDTKVRTEFERLAGDTTSLAQPPLTGKGVNRWTPEATAMMGVLNRVGTAQTSWGWATVTCGAGTDSITWEYNWGTDSLIAGENFVCCVPLEDQAATTNNLGLGTPFAGNLEVYPVYRVLSQPGVAEAPSAEVRATKPGPTVVRGMLFLPKMGTVPSGTVPVFGPSLLDVSGRKVMDLKAGANDVRAMPPGVYFVRSRTDAKIVKILLVD